MGDTITDTANWYREYYDRKGPDRNNLLKNPEVLFQALATDASVVAVLRSTGLDSTKSTVLDVGCGSGSSLVSMMRLGFSPSNLRGIDVLGDRIAEARSKLPNVPFHCGDARCMEFPDSAFDLVMEWTMFVQITDKSLSRQIAQEMLRVTKPGSFVLLVDWRYSKPGNAQYKGLNLERIRSLFDVGSRTTLLSLQDRKSVV